MRSLCLASASSGGGSAARQFEAARQSEQHPTRSALMVRLLQPRYAGAWLFASLGEPGVKTTQRIFGGTLEVDQWVG
jgi:hypothetical protein